MSKPQLPEGYTSERIEDIRAAGDDLIAELHELAGIRHAESWPGEPHQPLSETELEVRRVPADYEVRLWLVRDPDGRLVARMRSEVERTGDNEHICWVEVDVHPDHRRRGIGRWLLARGAEETEKAGCTIVGTWSESAVPSGEVFAKAFEFEPKLVFRESELDLTTLDWEMVDRWVAEGPKRAPGYALTLVEGTYPEEHYPNVIAWWETMNTAPREDSSMNDDHLTPERLGRLEEVFAASQKDRWEYVAHHVESGRFAGVTNVFLRPWNPAVIEQDATGVHPDHRGHALGKWLKAAMLQKIRDERPETKKIRTGNAYSNDAMLGINNELGFQESRSVPIWELGLEKALKLLS
jgi:mycothiol synthase